MIKLFIFDMDGVLFDTEPIYYDLNLEIYKELNIEITEEEYRGFIGIASDKKWGYIRDKHHLKFTLEELMKWSRTKKYAHLQTASVPPIPGVESLLKQLKKAEIPAVLASSSSRNVIKQLTSATGLDSFFSHFVSGQDIMNGKPAPDIFLKAMSYFDVSPNECVVVEDSRNGVLAAKAAHINCIGFKSEASTQDLSLANKVISSYQLISLQELIKDL